jgi:uncharacterized repeat protein (TIGR01451 family)
VAKTLGTFVILVVGLALVSSLFAPLGASSLFRRPAVVLDGHRDAQYTLLAEDPAGDLATNPGPGDWAGTRWTDQTALYVADDGTNLYVYVDLPQYAQNVSSGEIGLALDTTGDVPSSGGPADPWLGAVTFAYTSIYHNVGTSPVSTTSTILPDFVVRGNIPGVANNPPDDNNGWTELRRWDGGIWQGAGTNWGGIGVGGQVGTHVAYANNEGVEIAIPWVDLGIAPGSTVHLEFFARQKGPAKGAYDTVPSDGQSANWDDATVERHLATLAGGPLPTATPGGPTATSTVLPTVTPTYTPGPPPTITPTPGPGPCSGAAPGDGDIITAEVYHNSRKVAYREPFGPIPQDGYATLRLRVCYGDVQQVQVLAWKTGDPLPSPGNTYDAAVTGYDPSGPYDIWEVQVPALPGPIIDQWYQFRVTDGSRVGYYHVLAQSGNSGPGEWSDSLIDRSWRLSTYLAGFNTPDWMPDAVIYQIFPDRFRDGSDANDPVGGTTKYGPVTCSGSPCVVDLHASWTELPTQPAYGVDFFGGDLNGVIQKLGYLQSLGINTLYFNPVFEASSNHGYDTNDYYAIRQYFGGDAAFGQLVSATNALGIRLILDGVFNHAGSDSRYMDGYAFQYGQNKWPDVGACESASSPFRSWFTSGGTPVNCDGGWHWAGWYGFETIPGFEENDPVKDFFFRGGSPQSPGGVPVADYWIDQGAAGWRFDVAQDITHEWWQEMRPYVKAHDPQTLMMGEVTGSCSDYAAYLRGNELDSAMNYCFRDWIISWANGNAPSGFDNSLYAFREAVPRPAFYAMMNLVDSHDSTRVLRLLNDDKTRLKLLVLLQMTLPGAPSVYYGDEVGVTGGGDPDCRRTYPWADEGGSPDLDLLAHYSQIIGIRQGHPALRGGELETLLVDDATHLYSFVRWDGAETVVVVLNNAAGDRTAVVPVADYLANGTVLTDTLSGDTFTVVNGNITLPVAGQWGRILVAGAPILLPDLSPSTKSAPATVEAGATMTYTIVLRNSGGAAANAVLTDTLASQVEVITASLPVGMACAGSHCYWTGVVGIGAEVPLPFQVLVDAGVPTGTVLLNTGAIADGAGGFLTRQASTRVTVPPPPRPDLSLSGKGAPRTAAPGGVLTYTLQLINEGEVTANAVLTDTLPPSVMVVTASLPAGMACAGGVCTWSGAVPAYEMVELPYLVLVDGGVPTGTVLWNTMVVADGTGAVFTRTADTVIWTGPWPDLTPSDKHATPSVLPGGTITYTLVVSNVGQLSSTVLLTDILPLSVTVVTASLPAGMTCAGDHCYWFEDVGPGVEVRLRFLVVVGGDVPGGTVLQNRLVLVDDLTGDMVLREVYTVVSCRIYLPLVSR